MNWVSDNLPSNYEPCDHYLARYVVNTCHDMDSDTMHDILKTYGYIVVTVEGTDCYIDSRPRQIFDTIYSIDGNNLYHEYTCRVKNPLNEDKFAIYAKAAGYIKRHEKWVKSINALTDNELKMSVDAFDRQKCTYILRLHDNVMHELDRVHPIYMYGETYDIYETLRNIEFKYAIVVIIPTPFEHVSDIVSHINDALSILDESCCYDDYDNLISTDNIGYYISYALGEYTEQVRKVYGINMN